MPDATTLLKFRHLLEENHLGEQMFKAINYVLEQGGAMMKGGTIVDATIINAPSSIKNAEKARDPEITQRKPEIPKCIRRKRATNGDLA